MAHTHSRLELWRSKGVPAGNLYAFGRSSPQSHQSGASL